MEDSIQQVLVTTDGRSYPAKYDGHNIRTPLLLESGKTIWVVTLSVENPPARIIGSIRRAIANHGTVAAIHGGRLVIISSAE